MALKRRRDRNGISSSAGSEGESDGDGDRIESGVSRAGRRGEPPEGLTERRLLDIARRDERDHPQPRLGQGARLVDAQRVDGGERLDRVQLLRQRAGARHAQRSRRVGDRDEQDEPFRDQRDHARDRRVHSVANANVLLPERDDQHGAEWHHHADEHVQEAVDRPLERRAWVPELARGARDPARVAVLAHGGDDERPRSLGHERAGQDLVALLTGDGTRLAGEDRLVELQPGRLCERPVGDDLVTGSQAHEIALDHLLHTHVPLASIADDGRSGRDQRGERIELVTGAELLPDPDPRVGDDDPQEESVAPVGEHEREDAEREQDRVEGRDDVGANDARRRAARRGLDRLSFRLEPPARLRLCQTLGHGPRLTASGRTTYPGGCTLPFVWARAAISL